MAGASAILLVDDSPDDVTLMLDAIAGANINNPVTVVHDGEEALEYLFATGRYSQRNRSDVPAVVLLDMKLPKYDGIEVLRRLRADPSMQRIPVVFVTSSLEVRDVTAAYANGANSYIQKPMELDAFMRTMKEAVHYWTTLNNLPPPGDA